MAQAVVKRLTTRKVMDIRDEAAARAAIRHAVIENLVAEDALDADARKLLLEHAKMIKDSAAAEMYSDNGDFKTLARDRGFIL